MPGGGRGLCADRWRRRRQAREEKKMRRSGPTRALAIAFFAAGIYDLVGAVYYAFLVGTGRSFNDPPTHPFYSIFIASFLLCFTYLQFMSAFNIRRYLIVIGAVIIGRVFYAVLLFAYMASAAGFPTTLLPTGILDLAWTALFIVLTLISDELRIKDLFLPHLGPS
jgi:hypothetical protein